MPEEERQEQIIARCVELYDSEFAACERAGESETDAQRHAISKSFELAVGEFGVKDASFIWRAIDSAHVKRKSGALIEPEVIDGVRAASQSWNKSSGHAFEQSFCSVMNEKLHNTNMRFLLQREISALIKNQCLLNKERDLASINGWNASSVFDVFVAQKEPNEELFEVFGCVQCKTSIRDRVTRDREPSTQAMNSFFWSIAVVIDGHFLKLPKFEHMVNGGSNDYPNNGWHGMYAFSNCSNVDRVFLLEDGLEPLIEHSKKAYRAFNSERQWLDADWRP
ncbi:BsaWI family type II restriction enzyme [uncultured Roseovarius sp.]|uniref:BsaWI family type II restriction enzyme n=1 Tax=uncultured Roseovarius sp. TaxID=293344 RepID=UPI0025F06066|nr:BsaWI family type II restriction enzyme [uncultured Roseovarius sp.]